MSSEIDEGQLATQLDLARQLLRLEQRLDAYQRLYDDELDQIRRSLADCRKTLLKLLSAQEERELVSANPDASETEGWSPGVSQPTGLTFRPKEPAT